MELLQRRWVAGLVVPGDGRGRTLGFPTANLRLDHEIERPDDGIYAAWAKVETTGQVYKAVMHVGPRPSIEGADATVEIHLLESDYIDLYGHKLMFETVKKIRDVEKFESMDDLSEAIGEDCRNALHILVDAPKFL